MSRTGWLAATVLGIGAIALAIRLHHAPSPTLDCSPDEVRVVEGVARCAPPGSAVGEPLPANAVRTLGGRFDLNRVSEEELASIPGVGRRVAAELVRTRDERGGFRSWDEVDRVSGIGPARLARLQEVAEIRP